MTTSGVGKITKFHIKRTKQGKSLGWCKVCNCTIDFGHITLKSKVWCYFCLLSCECINCFAPSIWKPNAVPACSIMVKPHTPIEKLKGLRSLKPFYYFLFLALELFVQKKQQYIFSKVFSLNAYVIAHKMSLLSIVLEINTKNQGNVGVIGYFVLL